MAGFFLHRTPGLWSTQLKPYHGPQTFRLNPGGKLSNGLMMALIPEGPLGLGMLYDYVIPRTWTQTGPDPFNLATGPYGCMFNSNFSGTNQLTFTPTISPVGAAFSLSTLVLTDGSAHGGFNNVLISCGTTNTEYALATGATGIFNCGNPGAGAPYSGVASSVINMAGLTGWHRLGISCAGTTARFFLDGKFTDQGTLNNGVISNPPPSSLTGVTGNSSWGWYIADFFFWGRSLSDADMSTNFTQPYQSVLMPRYDFSLTGGGPVIPPAVTAARNLLYICE